jgi:hypothetical protein
MKGLCYISITSCGTACIPIYEGKKREMILVILNFHIKSRAHGVAIYHRRQFLQYKANVFYFVTYVEAVHFKIVTQQKKTLTTESSYKLAQL